MIAVDTNILARFYCDDPDDPEAERQQPIARRVMVESEAVKDAVELHRRGLDFADALHLATSAACRQFVSFDDRRFVRRARRLKLSPEVVVPR